MDYTGASERRIFDDFAIQGIDGLYISVGGGWAKQGGTFSYVPEQIVDMTLLAGLTAYIQIDWASNTIIYADPQWNNDCIPLYEITNDGAAITGIVDRRFSFVATPQPNAENYWGNIDVPPFAESDRHLLIGNYAADTGWTDFDFVAATGGSYIGPERANYVRLRVKVIEHNTPGVASYIKFRHPDWRDVDDYRMTYVYPQVTDVPFCTQIIVPLKRVAGAMLTGDPHFEYQIVPDLTPAGDMDVTLDLAGWGFGRICG